MLDVLYKENKKQYLDDCLYRHSMFCLTKEDKEFIKELLLLIDYYMEFVLNDYSGKTFAKILTLLKIDIHGNSMFLYLMEYALKNEDNLLDDFELHLLNECFQKVKPNFTQEQVRLTLQVIVSDYMLNPEGTVLVSNLLQVALLKFNMPNNNENERVFQELLEIVSKNKNYKLFTEFRPHYEKLLEPRQKYIDEECLEFIKEKYLTIPEHISAKIYYKNFSICVSNGQLSKDDDLLVLGSTHLSDGKIRIWFEDNRKAIDISFYHEFGHGIDYCLGESGLYSKLNNEWEKVYLAEKNIFFSYLKASKPKLAKIWENAISNKTEYFAEVFSEYIKNKEILKKYCPKSYEKMNELLEK